VEGLDGTWDVKRAGGMLPPLVGVKKIIHGAHGETRLGRLVGVPFRVDGLTLRYHAPFGAFVDVLEPDAEGYSGRATVLGREYGRFVLRPAARV
jgi:hypothetical protein